MTQSSGPQLSDRAFSECPIQVMVGSGKKIYYIHPSILTSCNSSVLNARMTGGWRNNDADKPLDWTNFDEVTIECVISYLYVKDYYVPEQTFEFGASSGGDTQGQPEEKVKDIKPVIFPAKKVVVEKKTQPDNELKRPLTPLDRCLEAGLPVKTRPTAAGVFDQLSKLQKGNFGTEILTHAKVYQFAHYFLFPELEVLALQRLTQVLLELDDLKMQHLFPQLADAIRAVYGGTPDTAQDQDPARKLLSQFVALKYNLLSGEGLDAVLAEESQFSVDVTRKLARRIARIDELEKRILENANQLEKAQEEITFWRRSTPKRGVKLTPDLLRY
ncbi:hypothetical protein DTO164E3_7300 [Paecilomyces variotii]|nr:hypothetical protein DTO164E3_7300 [Paecilomyces variotii]KAJ9208194.1 hypothetical protein DTO032I3_865 [Paecilomyces variotii]KAJ9282072.1 hypothetical protein DTO021D3_824 [Paecilomyces variotii]KAJ9343588.1 hypothetical protein DTO027B6_3806 [Paecilomyces variotii]KAJ9383059.1 hypothetical protein DTO032I4_5326 [Paecilomyces variotii]